MRVVAANLNSSKCRFRFLENTKNFSQAMKVYSGRHMCNLFSLNFSGPEITITKRENKRGVQFISGEHKEIFQTLNN